MRQLKSRRSSRVFDEYLENGSTDFHQIDRSFIVAMVTNSGGSAGLEIISKRRKVAFFLRFRTGGVFLS